MSDNNSQQNELDTIQEIATKLRAKVDASRSISSEEIERLATELGVSSETINQALMLLQEKQSAQSKFKYQFFAVVFVLFTIFDQVTKIWIVNNIRGPRTVNGVDLLEKFNIDGTTWREMPSNIDVIPGLFSIVHTQNAGAAFGIMQGQMFIFALFTIIAIVVIVLTLVQLPDDDRFQNFALALLTSGTIGNGIDRFHKQCVTDFLHVYSEHPSIEPILVNILGSNAWPSFNIADAAIVIGMIMFGIHYVFLEKDEEAEPDPPSEALPEISG